MFTPDEIQKAIDELAAKAMTANAQILAQMLQEYFALLGRMYANLSNGQELTWTQLNKYNRFNQYLKEFDKVTSSSFAKIVNKIKETREAVYVEAYEKDSYNTQIQASDDMGFSLPSKQVINQILDNKIEKMKLDKVMSKHRKEIVKKIQISIATGVQQGEGYPQIAKRLQQEVDFSLKKANLVTRTEIGRSRSLANEKVYEQANKYVKTTKIWLATLDNRTRHDHRVLDLQHADEKGYFHIRGLKAKAPRLFGVAHEDINCRCTTVLTPVVSRRARDYDNVDYQKKLAKRIDDLMAQGLTEKQAEKRANTEIKPPNKIVKWQSYGEWNSRLLNRAFKTVDDPIREIQGSMFESHPKETKKLIDDLEAIGIKVIFSDSMAMEYQPGNRIGQPGSIKIDKQASYSALLHEYTHAIDDKESGFDGQLVLWDDNRLWEREERAYNAEIQHAELNNLPETFIIRLKKLKEQEFNRIYKERWEHHDRFNG